MQRLICRNGFLFLIDLWVVKISGVRLKMNEESWSSLSKVGLRETRWGGLTKGIDVLNAQKCHPSIINGVALNRCAKLSYYCVWIS